MTSTTRRPSKRRDAIRDVIIGTLLVAGGFWISTWSTWGILVVAGVAAIAMAARFKNFR